MFLMKFPYLDLAQFVSCNLDSFFVMRVKEVLVCLLLCLGNCIDRVLHEEVFLWLLTLWIKSLRSLLKDLKSWGRERGRGLYYLDWGTTRAYYCSFWLSSSSGLSKYLHSCVLVMGIIKRSIDLWGFHVVEVALFHHGLLISVEVFEGVFVLQPYFIEVLEFS